MFNRSMHGPKVYARLGAFLVILLVLSFAITRLFSGPASEVPEATGTRAVSSPLISSPTVTAAQVLATLSATPLPPTPIPSQAASLAPRDASLRLNKGAVQWMILSPDGKTAYVASKIILCSYRIADVHENWCSWMGSTSSHPAQTLAMSPSGDSLAIGLLADGIVFFDSVNGAQTKRIPTSASFTSNLTWSPDSRQVAFVDGDGIIQIMDLLTGNIAATIPTSGFSKDVLRWTPDGSGLVAGEYVGSSAISLWKPGSDQAVLEQTIFPKMYSTTTLAWSPDSTELAAGSMEISCFENCTPTYDGIIAILDARTFKILRQVQVGKAVGSLAFNPDGTRFFAVLNGQEIVLFSAKEGTRLPVKLTASSIPAAAWLPDGQNILVANAENHLLLWKLVENRQTEIPIPGFEDASSLAWSPDSLHLAAVSSQGLLHIWDSQTGQVTASFGQGGGGSQVAWSPDGQQIAVTGRNQVFIWDAVSQQLLRTLPVPAALLMDAAWSPSGHKFATLQYADRLLIWDAHTWAMVQTIRVAARDFRLAWSPDEQHLATTGADGVTIWEATSGRQVSRFTDVSGADNAGPSWSPDGSRLAFSDGSVATIVEAATGKTLSQIQSPNPGSISGAVFSPSGDLLAVGTDPITLWEPSNGKLKLTLHGATGNLRQLKFSPDGKTLASLSENGSILTWEMP